MWSFIVANGRIHVDIFLNNPCQYFSSNLVLVWNSKPPGYILTCSVKCAVLHYRLADCHVLCSCKSCLKYALQATKISFFSIFSVSPKMRLEHYNPQATSSWSKMTPRSRTEVENRKVGNSAERDSESSLSSKSHNNQIIS